MGNDFDVIEEGLNGRTTIRESNKKEGKNGIKYLFPCLESHKPLHMVILALGTNDLKARYAASAEDIADGIKQLIEVIKLEGKNRNGNTPQILLIAPSTIEEINEDLNGGKEKSKQFGRLYKAIANENKLLFLDLAKKVKVSEKDGVHFDTSQHQIIAKEVAQIVTAL